MGGRRRDSGAALGLEAGERSAVFLFFEQLDLELGVFEAGFADFQEFGTLLKLGEEVGQRHVAGLHRLDDGLQLIEGGLE